MREIIDLSTLEKNSFIDLTLDVVECNKHNISASRVEYDVFAKGLYKNKEVGFGLLLSITKKLLKPLRIGVGINSLGKESNEFLIALAELYQHPLPENAAMKEYVPSTFVNLTKVKNKNALDQQKINFKMFFGNTSDNEFYSELFLNIDLPNRIIEFNEKDNGYRENIIKCFEQ